MAKPIIALYDVPELDQAAYRAGLGGDFELVITAQSLTADTAKQAENAEVLAVHVTSKVTADLMAAMPKLRHVACRSTGFDHVDLEYARAHHIAVTNVPAYGQETVAEYAILMLLAVARRLIPTADAVVGRPVNPTELTGHEFTGKTLGIIGTGKIGQHMAAIARGFGMVVTAYDLYPNADAAASLGFSYGTLEAVLAGADFLTLHAPATPETYHLLNAERFEHMKTGVFIVNTARGSLIDTPALITALKSGKVAGAGLDVLEGEEYLNLPEELNLLANAELGEEARQVLGITILHTMPNVLITTHNAYNSFEALQRICQTTIDNIMAWESKKPQNLVS